MRSVYARSFEHLNKVGIRASMNSKLEEQRAVINFLLLEDETSCHIVFKSCMKVFFIKPVYSSSGNCCPTRRTAKTLHPTFPLPPPPLPPTAPCEFYLFPELKPRLTGNNYETVNRYVSSRSTSWFAEVIYNFVLFSKIIHIIHFYQ